MGRGRNCETVVEELLRVRWVRLATRSGIWAGIVARLVLSFRIGPIGPIVHDRTEQIWAGFVSGRDPSRNPRRSPPRTPSGTNPAQIAGAGSRRQLQPTTRFKSSSTTVAQFRPRPIRALPTAARSPRRLGTHTSLSPTQHRSSAAEAEAAGEHDGVRAVGGLDLGEHVGDVVAHRLRAEHEPAGDGRVVEALGDELRGCRTRAAVSCGNGRADADRRACASSVTARASAWSSTTSPAATARRACSTRCGPGALDEVAAGAVAQRRQRRVVVLRHRQHDHLDVRVVLGQPAVDLQPRAVGEAHVEQQHVRRGAGDEGGDLRRRAAPRRRARCRPSRRSPRPAPSGTSGGRRRSRPAA